MSIDLILADEDQARRRTLRTLLAKEPDLAVVAEATDAQTALNLVRQLSPQMLIINGSLLDHRGLDSLRQLISQSPDLKVIALSTLSDRRLALDTLKAGASAYLLQDYWGDELPQAIRAVLARKIYLGQGVSDLVLGDYVQVLRDSEAQFRTVFEAAPFGIALLDQGGRLLETNATFQEMLGSSREELLSQSFFNFAHPEDVAHCHQLFEELSLGRRSHLSMEVRYLRKDGRLLWGLLIVALMPAGAEKPNFALVISEDISARKETEEALRAYQQQLRAMASELSWLEARERLTLATDLHDHVAQILALAQIKLGELRHFAATPTATAPLDEIRQLIEQTIKATRLLTFELSPPVLDDLGFEAALKWFGENLQKQSHLQVAVQHEGAPLPLGSEARVLLFRIVQELMINAAKHAGGSQLRVHIRREGDHLRIDVEDDGVGLDRRQIEGPQNQPRSFGLCKVRERLKLIQGRLEVESIPGRGARVSILTPLAALS